MTSRAVVSSSTSPPQIFSTTANISEGTENNQNREPGNTTSSGSETNSTSLDFIGPSDAVKSLFSVPYNADRPINVAIHNMEGTLLLDSLGEDAIPAPQRRRRRRPRPPSFDKCNFPPTREQQKDLPSPLAVTNQEGGGKNDQTKNKSNTLAMVTSMLEETSLLVGPKLASSIEVDEAHDLLDSAQKSSSSKAKSNDAMMQLLPGNSVSDLSKRLPAPENYTNIPLPAPPREYLKWKFHDLHLLVGSEALIYRDPHTVSVRLADADDLRRALANHEEKVQRGDFVADYQMARMQQEGKPSYAQALDQQTTVNNAASTAPYFSAPDYDRVQLQTCIVPSSTTPLGGLLSGRAQKQHKEQTTLANNNGSPVCTVLDAYLDNIIANVPQLALCLREKGFVQSVKLLDTKDIPSSLMLTSTLETTDGFSISKIDTKADGKPLFSPHIMDMNASTLLRFLKTNCTRNNSTYLLQREAGHSNIQLYDISSISAQRQRKWIWWLAMMSYRFALRLRDLNTNLSEPAAHRRVFRSRQRSLLENALNLLDDLSDMGGSANETLCAAVCENLAETFLGGSDAALFEEQQQKVENDPVGDRPATISSPPYANVSIDALNKAQDHLHAGIKKLLPLLTRIKEKVETRSSNSNDHHDDRAGKNKTAVVKVSNDDSSSNGSDSDADSITHEGLSLELQAISLQLFSLHHKLINVSLRLAEHHLSNYYSSSAMQALRTSARTIAGAISMLRQHESSDEAQMQLSLRYQFTWLWEHCGHFARSFAADDLWRERGHACGDDIISVLQDVENVVSVETDGFHPDDWFNFVLSDAPITDNTGGLVSLHEVSSIVEKEFATTIADVQKATKVLDQQRLIQKDQRRVLVAASVSYSRAIGIFEEILRIEENDSKKVNRDGNNDFSLEMSASNEFLSLLRQRLGDSCNEIGKILLKELRQLMISGNTDMPVAETMLHSAQFWFNEGLKAFETCNDLRNLALLRCNLCQCWKIRANAGFTSDVKSTHAEECLQTAANHLQKAHEALGQRDIDPLTWDMVSQELAATFLVLGVRRRQSALGGGATPVVTQALRLSPGQERDIVEPMRKALHIYQEYGNVHQAAAANYQLALFYTKVWTCQRDEAKTREKLSAAFTNYAAAHAYFGRAPPGNESTFVILCLDLSNLYSAVSGEEFLVKALSRCLDTTECFSKQSIEAARCRGDPAEWFEKMETLASTVEDRIFKLLVNLVRLEKESDTNGSTNHFKDLYRNALTSKMLIQKQPAADNAAGRMAATYKLLSAIKTAHN